MLIKNADDKSKRLRLLQDLQNSDRLDDRQKSWLREQLCRLKPGAAGERDAAHYLDMSFSDSKNHAVLHDLRLESDGQIAQIDHLVVDRMLTFFLLETKTYTGSLHINEHGEFMVEYSGERRFGIESPLEQSRRHETVLRKVLDRLGVCGRAGTKPTFVHVVMVHPKGTIHRPDAKVFDTSMVIKADQFATWHATFTNKIAVGTVVSGLLNARSRDTVAEWGALLKSEHRPADPLELPEFMKPKATAKTEPALTAPLSASLRQTPQKVTVAIKPSGDVASAAIEAPAPVCEVCQKSLTAKEEKYCKDQSKKFSGKFLCYQHQRK
jgi:hypothetical protein